MTTPKKTPKTPTTWQRYIQECIEFSDAIVSASARAGTACVEGGAALCRGGVRVMGEYVSRMGEMATKAVAASEKPEEGEPMIPASELSLEASRAYLNAWIQAGEAVRNSVRRFVELYLADKPA
jgi:hypothetical protein